MPKRRKEPEASGTSGCDGVTRSHRCQRLLSTPTSSRLAGGLPPANEAIRSGVLTLQRSVGNRATSQLIQLGGRGKSDTASERTDRDIVLQRMTVLVTFGSTTRDLMDAHHTQLGITKDVIDREKELGVKATSFYSASFGGLQESDELEFVGHGSATSVDGLGNVAQFAKLLTDKGLKGDKGNIRKLKQIRFTACKVGQEFARDFANKLFWEYHVLTEVIASETSVAIVGGTPMSMSIEAQKDYEEAKKEYELFSLLAGPRAPSDPQVLAAKERMARALATLSPSGAQWKTHTRDLIQF